jgi:hypothetical protein
LLAAARGAVAATAFFVATFVVDDRKFVHGVTPFI